MGKWNRISLRIMKRAFGVSISIVVGGSCAAFNHGGFLSYSFPSRKHRIHSFLRCIRMWIFFNFDQNFFKVVLYYYNNKKGDKSISFFFFYQIHIVAKVKPFASSLSRHLFLTRFLLMLGKKIRIGDISFYYKYPSI